MRTWVPPSAPSLLPAPTTEPFGLGAAPAVPPAPSVASTIPSSSWLEQQQLAEELSDSMLEAVGEVGIEEAIEETILASNEIVETMQEAIDEHQADDEDAIKVPTASLPPGPPSSSTGQSVAEQELTRSSAVDDSGVVTMAPDPMAR